MTRAARAGRAGSGAVRRLYLQRPQDGPAELTALRAEQAEQVQAHWVRGYWKQQWHPTIQQHR